MALQYPHTISIEIQPEFSKDASGNFQAVAGTGGAFTSSCRFEPAGENPVIKGDNGEDIVFTWMVYMPKTETELNFGDKVTITLANGSQYSGTLKRQYNGQFNSRLWV